MANQPEDETRNFSYKVCEEYLRRGGTNALLEKLGNEWHSSTTYIFLTAFHYGRSKNEKSRIYALVAGRIV